MSAKNFEVLGNRTRFGSVTVKKYDGKIAVQLHETDVVIFDEKKRRVKLNSGGWRTVTTKQAMNHALRQLASPAPFVRQTKGQWFVDFPGDAKICTSFHDGIEVSI